MSAIVHSVLIYSRLLSAITRLFVILNRREVVGVGAPIELLIQPSCVENRGEQLWRVRDEEKQLFMILLREEEWSRTRIFL